LAISSPGEHIARRSESFHCGQTEVSMRHKAKPAHSSARVARAPTRGALVGALFVVSLLGISSTSSLAGPTTTTTLSRATIAAGNAYAWHLLDVQPIPASARQVSVLPTPVAASGAVGKSPAVRAVHREYLLPVSVDVAQYVRAHLPRGEKVYETGIGTSPNAYPVDNLGLSSTCASRHITNCGVFYTTTQARDGQQELRVDVEVMWLPILHVEMPTTGIVTLTGYGHTSLANASSDPSTIVLNHHEVLALRDRIRALKDLGGNGVCAEDSLLLKISITQKSKVVWSAVADECPGALSITNATSSPILDDRNCSFWNVVNSYFTNGQAVATKTDSRQVCAYSPNG
jgi:hypothetical protein